MDSAQVDSMSASHVIPAKAEIQAYLRGISLDVYVGMTDFLHRKQIGSTKIERDPSPP